MSDTRNPETQVIYTAKNAFLVRGDSGPKLVMFDGMTQTLRTSDARLFKRQIFRFFL